MRKQRGGAKSTPDADDGKACGIDLPVLTVVGTEELEPTEKKSDVPDQPKPLRIGAEGQGPEPSVAVDRDESPTRPQLKLGTLAAIAAPLPAHVNEDDVEEEDEETNDPDTDEGRHMTASLPSTVVEVEITPDERRGEPTIAPPPEPPAQAPAVEKVTAVLGPPQAKESIMTPVTPSPPSPTQVGWTRAAAVLSAAVVVLGIVFWKSDGLPLDLIGSSEPTVAEVAPDKQEPAPEKAGLAPVAETVEKAEPKPVEVPKVPVSAPEVTKTEVVVKSEATAPVVVAKVEAVERPSEPVKAEPPPKVIEPPAKVETPKSETKVETKAEVKTAAAAMPTNTPKTLIVSAMGQKPACVADCTWGDLTDKGFPKTVEGKRTIQCGSDSWLTTSWTKIETGDQKSCFTVTGIEENPSGP